VRKSRFLVVKKERKKSHRQVTLQLSCLLLNHLLCPSNASSSFPVHRPRLAAAGREGGGRGIDGRAVSLMGLQRCNARMRRSGLTEQGDGIWTVFSLNLTQLQQKSKITGFSKKDSEVEGIL
jgi:hypothetical protein